MNNPDTGPVIAVLVGMMFALPTQSSTFGLTHAWSVMKFGSAAAFDGVDLVDLMRQGEDHMKPSTKDQLEGKLHELKGTFKEKAGQLTNDPNLEAEGQSENLAGKVQKKAGQIKKVFEK